MKFILTQNYYRLVLERFESLLSKLLELKPELDRETVQEAINQKKASIGAGYLTDQGALFLIAADHGVTLSEPSKAGGSIKELFVGAKEVSLNTRMISMSPAKQYSRKDGSSFYLRTMTVYDDGGTASVKLWDEKANMPLLDELKPGDLVKIIKAYVKSDPNGTPTINIGSGSSVEVGSEDGTPIPAIDTLVKDVSELTEEQKDLVASGSIDGPINTLQYTNSRGNPATALRMRLKGSDGRVIRVVLWGKTEGDIPKVIAPGAAAKLYGVRTKMGNQGDIEIHGSEATIIDLEGSSEIQPIIMRIISITGTEAGNTMALGCDKDGRLITVTDSAQVLSGYTDGQVIECMPSKAYGSSIITDADSFVRKLDDDGSIPTKEGLRTKVTDLKVGQIYCIEVIVLKVPDSREIQTRAGGAVMLAEMFVEDDTGEIWVKGWRGQARLISSCKAGEVVSVTGVLCKAGLEGRTELSLTGTSTITKKT